jgi:hypothetical protein
MEQTVRIAKVYFLSLNQQICAVLKAQRNQTTVNLDLFVNVIIIRSPLPRA